jgi:hypothetical protein
MHRFADAASVFFLAALCFVFRGFYGMRIEGGAKE